MSLVNMMTKFGWHSCFHDKEFDDFKVILYLSRYNKYHCNPEIEDFCHLDKKILAASSLNLGTHWIQYYFKQKK